MKKYLILLILLIGIGCTTKKQTIIQWMLNEDLTSIGKELVRAYMEDNPGTVINIVSMPDSKDHKKEIKEHLKQKNIDLYAVNHELLEYLIESQNISLIKSVYLQKNHADYFKGSIKICRGSSQTYYALPWIVDTSVLFYHAKVLSASDISPPFTWDHLAASINQIRSKNKRIYGIIIPALDLHSMGKFFVEAVWSSGLDVVTEDNEILLELPQVILLIQRFKKYFKKKVFSKKMLKYTRQDAYTNFLKGTSVFYYGKCSEWITLKDEADIRFTAIPHSPGYPSTPILDPVVLAASNSSLNLQETIKFMHFLISFPSQEILLMNDLIPAMRKIFEVSEAVQYKPGYEKMITLLDASEPLSFARISPKVLDILNKHIIKIFNGTIQPAEALYTASAQIRNLPRKRYRRKKKKLIPTVLSPKEKPSKQLTTGTTVPLPITGLDQSGMMGFPSIAPITGFMDSQISITGLEFNTNNGLQPVQPVFSSPQPITGLNNGDKESDQEKLPKE